MPFKSNIGYALIVSIYVILIFAILGITVAAFISTESIANLFSLSGLKALHIAEGGAEYVLVTDLATTGSWSALNGAANSNVVLGEGVFDTVISCTTPESCTIEASGYINRGNLFVEVKRQVELEVERTYEEGLSSAVYASDRINLSGTSGIVSGEVISGSDVVIETSGDYNVSSYESISLPPINWNGLRAAAPPDHYFGGGLTITDGQTLNGIYYAEGNVDIGKNVTINGSIICRGSLNMNQSNLYVSAEAGCPALLAEGTINGTQMEDSYTNGLVYSLSNITLNVVDNVTIVGAVVSGGRISIVNGTNFNMAYDSNVKNNLFIGSPAQIVITRWTNL